MISLKIIRYKSFLEKSRLHLPPLILLTEIFEQQK